MTLSIPIIIWVTLVWYRPPSALLAML
jgi:hypothetical protein